MNKILTLAMKNHLFTVTVYHVRMTQLPSHQPYITNDVPFILKPTRRLCMIDTHNVAMRLEMNFVEYWYL